MEIPLVPPAPRLTSNRGHPAEKCTPGAPDSSSIGAAKPQEVCYSVEIPLVPPAPRLTSNRGHPGSGLHPGAPDSSPIGAAKPQEISCSMEIPLVPPAPRLTSNRGHPAEKCTPGAPDSSPIGAAKPQEVSCSMEIPLVPPAPRLTSNRGPPGGEVYPSNCGARGGHCQAARSRSLVEVIHLGNDLPMFSLGGVGQADLARHALPPPLLRLRIGGHLGHVGRKVIAHVLEVTE